MRQHSACTEEGGFLCAAISAAHLRQSDTLGSLLLLSQQQYASTQKCATPAKTLLGGPGGSKRPTAVGPLKLPTAL